MSTATIPPHLAMRELARGLRQAARHYRIAWRAQAEAVAAWAAALEGLEVGLTPAAAQALNTFNDTADRAQLLDSEVDLDSLQHLEQGALQLEAVAQAATALADMLLEGGLQS